jgi:putative flippase GtrA
MSAPEHDASSSSGLERRSLMRGWHDSLRNLMRWFVLDRSFIAKGLRFALVGGTSGLIFAVATAFFISCVGADERLASMAGYLISMPINFFANRTFAFQSRGRAWADALRFVALHILNVVITVLAMETSIKALGLHYAFGIAGAIICVPLISFILMNIWVFRHSSWRHPERSA